MWTRLDTVSAVAVKLVRLTPEPKPLSFGIAARKGRLSPATEKFWQCAKEAFSVLR